MKKTRSLIILLVLILVIACLFFSSSGVNSTESLYAKTANIPYQNMITEIKVEILIDGNPQKDLTSIVSKRILEGSPTETVIRKLEKSGFKVADTTSNLDTKSLEKFKIKDINDKTKRRYSATKHFKGRFPINLITSHEVIIRFLSENDELTNIDSSYYFRAP